MARRRRAAGLADDEFAERMAAVLVTLQLTGARARLTATPHRPDRERWLRRVAERGPDGDLRWLEGLVEALGAGDVYARELDHMRRIAHRTN